MEENFFFFAVSTITNIPPIGYPKSKRGIYIYTLGCFPWQFYNKKVFFSEKQKYNKRMHYSCNIIYNLLHWLLTCNNYNLRSLFLLTRTHLTIIIILYTTIWIVPTVKPFFFCLGLVQYDKLLNILIQYCI